MVHDTAIVPEKFVLVLTANGAARRRCSVVWRNSQQAGLKFEQNGASETTRPLKPVVPERESAVA